MTTITNWLTTLPKRSGIAYEHKSADLWLQVSWAEYFKKIVTIADQLKSKGMQKGSLIGLVSATRPEWAICDVAILCSQAITVPMYPNLSDEDVVFIVNHSEMRLVILENAQLKEQFLKVKKQFKQPLEILTLDDLDFSKECSQRQINELLAAGEKIKPEDSATVVYTSGTTGQPKGVLLLHEAIVSEVVEAFGLFGVDPSWKSLTFLPFAHVLGRIEHFGSLQNGHTLAYAESIEKVRQNLSEVKPDFIIAVPRIFEKVYSGIMAQVETQNIKLKLFQKALEISKQVQFYRKTKQNIPWAILAQYEVLSRLVFKPIQKAFGGHLKFAISGGAPLSLQLSEFFSGCGIKLLEGYGLTETFAAITVNTMTYNKAGTVGKPIGDVDIKFADDGEILVKSKKCLKEYYKNPDATAASITDGYFATGDIGEFTEDGFLKITDRKKDLIKTAGGKYVAPQKLEGFVKEDPLVSQVLIIGDQKKFVSTLISIEEPALKNWAESQNITFSDIGELYENPVLRRRLQKHIQSLNSRLASYESIKKFEIVKEPWTVENNFLTQSMKVKRKIVEQFYKDLINEIYE